MINIFCATSSLAINYNFKHEDLSSLFNQQHNNFKAFEDLDIKFYIYNLYLTNILETSNNELVYDTSRLVNKSDTSRLVNKSIKFNSNAFKIIEAGGGGDCFFHSIVKGLKLNQYNKDPAIEINYFNHRELRKLLAQDYQMIAEDKKINILDDYDKKINSLDDYDKKTQLSMGINAEDQYVIVPNIYEEFKDFLKDEAKTNKIQNDDPLIYAQSFKDGTLNTPYYAPNIMLLLEKKNVSYAYFSKQVGDNYYQLLVYKKIADKPLIFVYFNGINHYQTLALYDEIMPTVMLQDIKIEDVEKRVSFSTLDLIQSDELLTKNLSQALFDIMQEDGAFAKDFVEKTEKQSGLDEYVTQLFTYSSVKEDAFRFMHNKAINIVHNNIRPNNHLTAVSAGSNEDKFTNLWGQILIGRDYFIQDDIDITSSSDAIIGGIDFNIDKNLLVGGFLSLNNFTVYNGSKTENNENIIGGIYADFLFTSDISLSTVFGGSRIISKIEESENSWGYFADTKFKYKLRIAKTVELITNVGYRLNKNCDLVDNFSDRLAKINSGTSHNLLVGLNLLIDNFKLRKVNISSEIHVLKDFEMYNSDRTVQKRIGKILLPSMHTNSEVKNSDTMTAGALVMADLGVFKINVGVDWMFGKKYNGWLVKLNMRLSI